MLQKDDWNQYAGCPNQFFAAPGDRILHREIPEQEELFWQDFIEGRNGAGFRKIDCPENRELLLQKYATATGNALVVRSALNEVWRKYVITYGAANHGFIDPNPEEEVDDRPRNAEGRLLSSKELQWQQWQSWVNDQETPMRAIREKRRTDPAFAEFYAHHSAEERMSTAVGDAVENLNIRQATPSTQASKQAASPEVHRFAQDYRTMSSEQVKTLLSPGRNPLGAAAAQHNQELFDQACAAGLI